MSDEGTHVMHWRCERCHKVQILSEEVSGTVPGDWILQRAKGLVCPSCGLVGTSKLIGHIKVPKPNYVPSEHNLFGGIRP